jgi:hypothetical protein
MATLLETFELIRSVSRWRCIWMIEIGLGFAFEASESEKTTLMA